MGSKEKGQIPQILNTFIENNRLKQKNLAKAVKIKTKEDISMPHTVEAVYHDGVIELKEIPSGIKRTRVLVTFPDQEEENKISFIDWNKVKKNKSTVDKWIGFLEGTDIGDWKAARRKYLEDKHN